LICPERAWPLALFAERGLLMNGARDRTASIAMQFLRPAEAAGTLSLMNYFLSV
jgi:hypothetical protein